MVFSTNGPLNQSQMTTNAQYIMNVLVSKYGWSRQAVAGLLGNAEDESTINPGRHEVGSGSGFGLLQWTPGSILTNWANSQGLDPNSIDTQIARIVYEVKNGIQWYAKSNYPLSFTSFTQSKNSPDWLASAFMYDYERPSARAIAQTEPSRRSNALKWYNLLTPGAAPPSSGITDGSSSDSSNANNAFQNITIPQTNYSVVPYSNQYGDILYGRRYRVIVANANGVALDVSNIRCTFNIQKTIMQQPPISEIVLYNLNADTENTIIEEGSRVVIEAGYEGDQYGLIFDGDIVQPIRDKQDATTYRLTLRAIDGDRFINYGFVGFSLIKGQTARSQVGALASMAKYPTQLGTISQGLEGTQLTRGKVFFGQAKDYLSQIAKSQNATYYYENGKVNLIQATDYDANTIVDLSPSSGLLNVPSQSQYGVSFTAMLNPKIKINSLVHIDNSLIRAQSFEQGQPIRNLDQDGIYRVVSVTFVGDTRGTDWNIQCDTVSQAGLIPGNANGLSTNATFNPYGPS
jgi:hypothetical protein